MTMFSPSPRALLPGARREAEDVLGARVPAKEQLRAMQENRFPA